MLREITGDGIPDYVVTRSEAAGGGWWVFAGYIEEGAYAELARGGFVAEPMLWRVDGSPAAHALGFEPVGWSTTVQPDYSNDYTRYPGGTFVELDGDGRIDYLRSNGEARINHGRGFAARRWALGVGLVGENGTTDGYADQLGLYVDADGDGRTDKMYLAPVTSTEDGIFVAYNEGLGFGPGVLWLGPDGLNRDITLGKWQPLLNQPGLVGQMRGIADIDGDGLVDYVHAANATSMDLYSNDGSPDGEATYPNLLIRVHNGVGGATTLRYATSTTFPSVRLPFVADLLTSIEPYLTAPREDLVPTAIRYEDGVLVMDPQRHVFRYRGFGTIERVRAGAVGTVETYAIQDPILHFAPTSIQETDALGRVFRTRTLSWTVRTVSGSLGSVHLPFIAEQTDTRVEPGSGWNVAQASIQQTLEIDDYGNVLRRANLGDADDPDDDVYSETTFATAIATPVSGYPASMRDCADDACNTVFAEVYFRYDGDLSDPTAALPDGSVERGNLKSVRVDDRLARHWGANGSYVAKRFAYDAWGNRTVEIEMRDATNGNTTEAQYDPRFHLFPTAITVGNNVAGGTLPSTPHTTTYTTMMARGFVSREQRPDGLDLRFTPDPFDRRVRTHFVDDQGQLEPLEDVTIDFAGPSNVMITTVRHHGAQQERTVERLDGLLRSRSISRPGSARTLVLRNVDYDPLGRPRAESEPHWSGATGVMTTYRHYDEQGRPAASIVMPEQATPPTHRYADFRRVAHLRDALVVRHRSPGLRDHCLRR